MGVGFDIIDKFILFWGCGVILRMFGNVYIEYRYCWVCVFGVILLGFERLVWDLFMRFVVIMCDLWVLFFWIGLVFVFNFEVLNVWCLRIILDWLFILGLIILLVKLLVLIFMYDFVF